MGLFRRVRHRLTELKGKAHRGVEQLRRLESERFARRAGNPAVLDAMPVGEVNLLDCSDELVRGLLEALRLEVRYARTRRASASSPVETVSKDAGNLIVLDDARTAEAAENAATSTESASCKECTQS